jgi:hypothetical protein
MVLLQFVGVVRLVLVDQVPQDPAQYPVAGTAGAGGDQVVLAGGVAVRVQVRACDEIVPVSYGVSGGAKV